MSFSPKKIVVATDFSPQAAVAADVAADLALRSGGSLVLFHVVSLATDAGKPGKPGQPPDAGGEAAFTANAKAQLEGEAERVRKAGVPVTTSVTLYGPPQDQIAQLAGQQGAELVVVGSHGRTGLKRVLMGSVAEGAVRLCPCPVLVVHLPRP
ncbi:MAG TPA: universal stress protein [Myxococcales bacterium]|nr:universal stress protein [Myxococcales bacterium]